VDSYHTRSGIFREDRQRESRSKELSKEVEENLIEARPLDFIDSPVTTVFLPKHKIVHQRNFFSFPVIISLSSRPIQRNPKNRKSFRKRKSSPVTSDYTKAKLGKHKLIRPKERPNRQTPKKSNEIKVQPRVIEDPHIVYSNDRSASPFD